MTHVKSRFNVPGQSQLAKKLKTSEHLDFLIYFLFYLDGLRWQSPILVQTPTEKWGEKTNMLSPRRKLSK